MPKSVKTSRSFGLNLITSGVAVLMGLVIAAAVFFIERQQSQIESKAQRIFDVAMPMVFEATRMIRSLERLARDGESILWIEDRAERAERRQRLLNIEGDGALQGDSVKRALIAQSFAVLDQNLADLSAHGASARSRSLKRWEPIQLSLLNASESVGAEVSTAASDDAESIVQTANVARNIVLIASAAVALVAATLGFFLYVSFTRPILRLARFLNLVHEGDSLSTAHVYIRELQVLNDAAVELARAHRELKVTRGQLEQLAHTDALTGLANRRMFEIRGNEEFERSRRYAGALAVVAFDIDHFKDINDRFSHDGGDAVLRALGALLQVSARSADLPVARVGGEEFTMLLPQATLEMARDAAERIRQGIEQLEVSMPNGESIHFTVSVGVAACQPGDANLQTLLHRADLALYQAKEGGRNRVELAT